MSFSSPRVAGVLGVAAIALVALTAGWLLAASKADYVFLSLAAGALLVALWRWPFTTVLLAALLAQDLNPANGFGADEPLLVIGHELYFTEISSVSLFTLVLVAATLARPRSLSCIRRAPVALAMLGLGVWCAALAIADGSSILSAINQNGGFALLFLLCFSVSSGSSDNDVRMAAAAAAAAILATAAGGLLLFVTGRAESIAGGVGLVFYDGATAAVAGAATLLAAFRLVRGRHLNVLVGVAGLVALLLSFRRNAWLGTGAAFVAGVVFVRQRAQTLVRVLLAASTAAVLLWVAAPGLANTVVAQASTFFNPDSSVNAVSTRGHLEDIQIGWSAVRSSPIVGVGPTGRVPGLVVESNSLYIHSEYLQIWLRYGFVGFGLLVTFLAISAVDSTRALRREQPGALAAGSAFLTLIAPVALYTAPYLSTTNRWAALLGLAAGVLYRSRVRQEVPLSSATDVVRECESAGTQTNYSAARAAIPSRQRR